MTTLKIVGNPASGAMQALEPHVARMYNIPGVRVMAIIELTHVERVQPAPGADSKPTVRMKVTACEVPNQDQEGAIREAQRALFLARTARGTLDEEGMVELDEETLNMTAGLLMSIETARLRVGLAHWAEYARKLVATSSKLIESEILHEVKTIADGMAAVLGNAAPEEED
jgi:hypothetical protein